MLSPDLSAVVTRLDRIASELDVLKRARTFPWWEKPVLTTDEAMEYTGIPTMRTFHRKMQDWGVSQCEPQIWPRHKIDAAMNRIRRNTFKSNRGRKAS